MFSAERILFPTDFSDCSKSVLPYVLSFAEAHKSHVTILNVVEFEELQHLTNAEGASEVEGSYLAKRTEALQAMVGPHPELHMDFVVREGHAFKEILRLAEESDIDIIIMATHGRTGFEHILIGSVAEKVVRHSDRPVLIVKPQKDSFRKE
jgi:nucleotide-binding universal stress UspA family protein